jgi:hypothetical protein
LALFCVAFNPRARRSMSEAQSQSGASSTNGTPQRADLDELLAQAELINDDELVEQLRAKKVRWLTKKKKKTIFISQLAHRRVVMPSCWKRLRSKLNCRPSRIDCTKRSTNALPMKPQALPQK